MRKFDEFEKYQSNIALKIVFSFYNISLFICIFVDYIEKGKLGIPFLILFSGQLVYLIVIAIQKKRLEKYPSEEKEV